MGIRSLLSIAAIVMATLAIGIWWYVNDAASRSDGQLTLYGNVDIHEVQLAFEISGRIAQLMAVEGERVQRGQVVAQLRRARYKDMLDQLQGQVVVAEQTLAKLEAGTRPEEIERARAEVEAARAEAKNAWGRYQRLKSMESKNAISPQDVDDAKSAAQAAQGQLVAARKTLALALAGPRYEDIARARGKLQMAQAGLKLAQRDLDDTTLRAPAPGIIRTRILEVGDMAAPDVPVYTIALDEPLWVRTYVPETELSNLRPGMAAVVYTDSRPEEPYKGWVGHISPSAEFTPKSVETPELRTDLVYQVRVNVCDARGELRLGMPVTVVIPRREEAAGPGGACRNKH